MLTKIIYSVVVGVFLVLSGYWVFRLSGFGCVFGVFAVAAEVSVAAWLGSFLE